MADPSFDAFLSYRSADRQTVEQIAVWLKEQGLAIWFDRWKLRPGLPWQEAIEVGLKYSKSIVVFVGEGGLGPWEEPEMRVALNEQVRRGCPVIPILLPKAGDSPDIPMFLRSQQWIDMRSGWPDTHGAVNLIWGITGREPLEIKGFSPPAAYPKAPRVFVANRIVGSFARVFKDVIEPTFRRLNLTFETLNDCETRSVGGNIAEAMEEAALQAEIIIWNFDSEAPWIPVFLQTNPQPGKSVIVLASRGLAVPEILSYAQVVHYNSTKETGITRFRADLTDILSAFLSPTKLGEAQILCRLKHYDAAMIAASNYLFDLLRDCAVATLGYSYFREKPLRYYSLSELFKIMMGKRKLRMPAEVDWRRLVELRNIAVHGNLVSSVDQELCEWYIRTVECIGNLNSAKR